MKKTLLSIAFLMAGMFAMTMNAQQPATDKQCQKECCQQEKGKHGQKAPRFNPFEGITLTAEQEAAVKALNEKSFKSNKEARDQRKQEGAKLREAGKENRKEYLKEMQKILTPEQYVTYLENLASKPEQAPRHNMPKGKQPGKDHKGKKEVKVKTDRKEVKVSSEKK